MKFKEFYKFEKNDEEKEDVLLMEVGKIEEEDVSVSKDASTEEEEEIEHEFNKNLPIFNFASCTSDELITLF